MKALTHKWKYGLWLAIFLFSFLGSNLECKSQWWKDTVWTQETDQGNGFYILKFSKNDSIIVGHGYEMDLFFDAMKGYEIIRITGNNEVFFINNDKNFIRLKEDNSKFEIFDTKTYTVVDSIENDGFHINEYPIIDISKDERYIIAGIPNGFRIWDILTKRIYKTKIYPNETNLKSVGIDNPRFICGTNKVMVQLSKQYTDHNYGDFVVYDINTLDSVDSFGNHRGFVLSKSCKYIAYGTGDPYNGVEVYDFNTKELLWKIPVNGPNLTGLEFSPDDNYLVTAPTIMIWDIEMKKKKYQYSSGSSNNIALSHDGKYIVNTLGGFIVKFPARWDGVSINEPYEQVKILYPNPTNNTITLTFDLNSTNQLNYSIFDDNGQLIKPLIDEFTYLGTIEKTFEVSDLPSGNYFLKISGADFGLTFKVIKMR